MNIYLITVNCTYYDSKHLSKRTIDKKEDYSCIFCWGSAKFNERTSVHRFWEFYQLAFSPVYQANSVTWQAYTQLVSTLTKKVLTTDDEDLAERLSLKLVKSIRYHYSSEKPVAITAQVIQKVIATNTRFAEGSAPHIVLAKNGSTTNFWSPLSFNILAKVVNINLQYYNCSAMSQLFCNTITNS